MNTSVIGSELLIKVNDMEPLYLDTISSKSRGRVTIDFNKGIRIYLKMNRTTAPNKIPVIIIAASDGMQYAGGVNALELFQESIKFKQPSSVAREHTKLTSSFGHDGALITYKLRMTVEKVPIATKEKTAPTVNSRSADILRKNEQYRKIYRDLAAQVSFLEEKVDRIKMNQKNQTQVKFQRKAVETQPQTFERYRTKASFENRSRPPLEFQFDDEQKSKRKNRNSDSGIGVGMSDSNDYASNKFSSQASFEIISASDNKKRKKKRQQSSSESFDEYPADESFSGIDDADVENSNESIDDVVDVEDDDKNSDSSKKSIDDVVNVESDDDKNSGSSKKSSDVIEDVVDDIDSDDDKNKKKKSNKKKESSSNSFESVGSFASDSDDKSSGNKKSAKTSSGSSNSKKILSENSDSKRFSSSSKLLSETSGSKKLSSNSKSKRLSSDSKSNKKSSGSTALSDFKSDESSDKKKSEFESFSSEPEKKSDDDKKDSDSDKKKASPSDPFASNDSF